MNRNTYGFKLSKIWSFESGIVAGDIIGRRGETGTISYQQIQEHKETIYSIGYLRIIAYHTFKFIEF